MPKEWSPKRERQYEHVKESAKKQGRSTKVQSVLLLQLSTRLGGRKGR